MENSGDAIYWIIGLIAIGVIAGSVYYNYLRKRKCKNQQQFLQKQLTGTGKEQIVTQPVTPVIPATDIETEVTPSLVPIIKYFKGQCNSFKMVSESPRNIKSCEQVFNYADKVIEYHADENIKSWWKFFTKERDKWNEVLYRDKAKQILIMIRKAGVTPSTEKVLKWDENATLHYMPFDDIVDGDLCNVIQPCWIYQNDIFEQGLVSKKTNQ